jgi:hypothetical protein
MRRILVGMVSAAMLLIMFVPVVFAGDQFYGCTPDRWDKDPSRWILYENQIGDTSDGNDRLLGCANVPNLHDVPHTLPGKCEIGLFDSEDWGDCTSSMYLLIPSGQVFCYWEGPYYTAGYGFKVGPYSGRFNQPVGYDISSIGFVAGVSGSNCLDM